MQPPLAEVSFEATLAERVDVTVRASRRLQGRLSWGLPVAAALLGSLALVVALRLLEPDEPAATAWASGGATLAILALLLPPIVVLGPRVMVRKLLARQLGAAPHRRTVTLTDDEVAASEPLFRLSMRWRQVVQVYEERGRIVIVGRAATIFVGARAFADAAQQQTFLTLARRLAGTQGAAQT